MSLTLGSLIEDLEKQAGLFKQAEENPEKDEKKKEEEAKENVEKADKDVKEAEKDVEKAEKDNGKEQTKEAQAKGADLAKEVMQKVASIKLDQVNLEDNMTKQAAEAGKAMAQALLEKLASVGDQNTMNGIGSPVPNKTQVDLAAQVAEQAAQVQAQPGTDGRGNGGTINQIFDAIVADAIAKGASPLEQDPGNPSNSAAEGAQVAAQTPGQVGTMGFVAPGQEKAASDEHEKAAAVSQLVSEGYGFEDAVNMVKAAAAEIEKEEASLFKQAALSHLIENGIDFDTAVTYVKKHLG